MKRTGTALVLGAALSGGAFAQLVQVTNVSELNLTVEQGRGVTGETRYCLYYEGGGGLVNYEVKAQPLLLEDGTPIPYTYHPFGDGYVSGFYEVNDSEVTSRHGPLGGYHQPDCRDHAIRVTISPEHTTRIGTATAEFAITVMPF